MTPTHRDTVIRLAWVIVVLLAAFVYVSPTRRRSLRYCGLVFVAVCLMAFLVEALS